MRPRLPSTASALLGLALLLAACPAPGGPGGGTDGGGTLPDGGTSGGGTDGGGGGTDGGGTDGGGVADPTPPALGSLSASGVGRFGEDLGIAFSGTDPNGDALALRVRVLDAAGDEVPLFDADWNGQPDSGATRLTPEDELLGLEQFSSLAVLEGLLGANSAVAQVAVALEDAGGLVSGWQTVPVSPQPVKSLGAPCDPLYVENRCDDGLGCHGTPGACEPGVAPELTRLAYLRTDDGVRILAEGEDPDDDLETLHLEFLDGSGRAVMLDLDNDGSPDSSSFDVEARGASAGGTFFVGLTPGGAFAGTVARIAATPIDVASRSGARQTADLEMAPQRYRGQSCDLRGFNVCGTSMVCAPGLPDVVNTCQAAGYMRRQVCGQAEDLDLSTGTATWYGRAEGASLWDPPAGCTATDPAGEPEGVVRLHLAQDAATLDLTTDLPGTTFDTIVYLLPDCPDDTALSLGCSDDGAMTAASTLHLTDVPAGDYLVVVDGWQAEGGLFELRVEAR